MMCSVKVDRVMGTAMTAWLLSTGCVFGFDMTVPESDVADDGAGVDTGFMDGGDPTEVPDVETGADAADSDDGAPDADAGEPPDVDASGGDVDDGPDVDVILPPDADAELDADTNSTADADAEAEVTPSLRCADLDCAAEGRVCDEGDDATDARCGICLSGFIGEGEACVEVTRVLGATCSTDSECPSGSWCSTIEGFERCSPRLFAGEARQMDFVYVPAGTFEQGTPGATNEERPYTATLTRSYFVSRTELTQGQWKAATGLTNPSCFQSIDEDFFQCSNSNSNNSGPLEEVDWYSSLAYANWLSSQNGLQQCYTLSGCIDPSTGWHDGAHEDCTEVTFAGLDCTGYRLLTESEWERAARGGSTSTYYWGEATDTETMGQYAWFNENSGSRTQAVGQKIMNAYGLYDMSGNVAEWVWDWVYSRNDWIPYPSGSATDYLGGPSDLLRGLRGGSWRDSVFGVRSARRYGIVPVPAGHSVEVGFRLARTVP